MTESLAAELASGDKRRALKAVRRVLAERIADGPRPRELAALSWRLMRVMEALDEDATPRRVRRARRHLDL